MPSAVSRDRPVSENDLEAAREEISETFDEVREDIAAETEPVPDGGE